MQLIVTLLDLDNFGNWLKAQKYQTNTIRNYLLDLNSFLIETKSVLSTAVISEFIARDTGKNNHSRHLASISKFCQFAIDQHLIDRNFFPSAKKHAHNPPPTHDLELLLTQFSQSLIRSHKSPLTIKGYLGDIRQYVDFCESQKL